MEKFARSEWPQTFVNMVLVFDLDDTLYDERNYVESGFRAVAAFCAAEFGWDQAASFNSMVSILKQEGRGKIFDIWLGKNGLISKKLVQRCLHEYRRHTPTIDLFPNAKNLLRKIEGYPKYVVTDGNKLVQQKKVMALGINSSFRHIFITHRYGIRNAKPSIHCFEIIKNREGCLWEDMLYVGDNPAKDFVGLNRIGAKTVRVLTGEHRNVKAMAGCDAQITIPDLSYFFQLLKENGYEK